MEVVAVDVASDCGNVILVILSNVVLISAATEVVLSAIVELAFVISV